MNNVAFLTKTNRLNSLIESFRKSSVNAKKCSIDDLDFHLDVLIIDLDYPLDGAYVALEIIGKDYRFSDVVVLSVISHKSQLTKLRSMALGSDGFISENIPYKDLVFKIQEIQNPDRFLIKKDFSGVEVVATLPGTLTHLSEAGCVISTKAYLSADSDFLEVSGKDLAEIGELGVLKLGMSGPLKRRSFVAEVSFSTLSEEARKKIRQSQLNWGVL